MSTKTSHMNLCTQCIGGDNFSEWIAGYGEKGKCEFDRSHGKNNHVISIKEFAEYVDYYFREHYTLGEYYPYFEVDSDSPSYHRHGKLYSEILGEDLLWCDEDVLNAVIENLPDECRPQDGEESFYEDWENYESIEEAEERHRLEFAWEEHWYKDSFGYKWNEFCETVKYKNRFFKIKEMLDELFGEEDEYATGKINPIYLLKKDTKVFRARLLDDSIKKKLEKKPEKELGVPPKEIAKAGRMNVEFIPAFYGAFSEVTAIAEIRPSIYDEIAIGEFTLCSSLKVFDFTVFDHARDNSDFNYENVQHTRYDFISQIQHEISKPITPYEKKLEYIPTQIVAEYLKEHFGCHAVIYNSSMHKDGNEARNIVIFNNGNNFTSGESPMLKLNKYGIKTVKNITYDVEDSIYF